MRTDPERPRRAVDRAGKGALFVTPTYNEALNIEALIEGVHAVAPEAHLLVVDDASPDGTGAIADRRAKADPRVHLLARPGKQGLGTAYVEGFAWGLARGYQLFFEIDADLSHDPRHIPSFFDAFERGADVVVGSRLVPGGGVIGWGLGRRLLSRGGSRYARTLLGAPVRDMTTGFKAYTREALARIDTPTLSSDGYSFQIETTYRALREGLSVVEVPIVFVDRREGSSKMSGAIIAEAVWVVLRLSAGRARRGLSRSPRLTGPGPRATSLTSFSALPHAARRPTMRLLLRLSERFALVRILHRDPLLAALVLIFSALTLAPIFVTPFIPLQDLPDHVGMTSLWPLALRGEGLPGKHYIANLQPMPYWTSYAIMIALRPLLGAVWMAKAIVALTIISVPLGVIRLLGALGRDPRLGLLAFAFCWDYNIAWGWLSYVLGVGLGMFAIAQMLEAESPRDAWKVAPLTALVAFTHVFATGVLAIASGLTALVSRRPLHRLGLHAISGMGAIVALSPWLYGSLFKKKYTEEAAPAWHFDMHTPAQKIRDFFEYTVNMPPGKPADVINAALFVTIVTTLLVVAALPSRKPGARDHVPVLIGLAVLIIYMLAPMNVGGPMWHTFTFPRFAVYSLLFAITIPRPSLSGLKVLALAPALLAIAAYDWVIYKQFEGFGRESAPFLKIIEAVRPNSAVFPLTFDDSSKHTKLGSYNQFHAYVAAAKLGYDPFLFDYPTSPLVYKSVGRPPQTAWNRPGDFTMDRVGMAYDYIMVQGGLANDPVRNEPRAHLVTEAGRWRLYEVKK